MDIVIDELMMWLVVLYDRLVCFTLEIEARIVIFDGNYLLIFMVEFLENPY